MEHCICMQRSKIWSYVWFVNAKRETRLRTEKFTALLRFVTRFNAWYKLCRWSQVFRFDANET
jgi:hypothetical protein